MKKLRFYYRQQHPQKNNDPVHLFNLTETNQSLIDYFQPLLANQTWQKTDKRVVQDSQTKTHFDINERLNILLQAKPKMILRIPVRKKRES